MRCRYVHGSRVKKEDNISDYVFVSANELKEAVTAIAVRIEIPDKIPLEKEEWYYKIPGETNLKIKDCNPKIFAKINSELKEVPALTNKFVNEKVESLSKFDIFMQKYGYHQRLKFGYVTNEQSVFLNENFEQSWQLDKVPSNLSPEFCFVCKKEYKERFGYFISKLKFDIKNNEELGALIEELGISDEELLDKYEYQSVIMHGNKKLDIKENTGFILDELKRDLEQTKRWMLKTDDFLKKKALESDKQQLESDSYER